MDNKKSNIVEQINSGFINIESVSDFEELLNDFSEDPALQKACGNLLVKKDASDEAALSCGKSAALYLKSGKLLPAIVTKLLQWRIKSPDYQDAQLFLAALNDNSLPDTPLKVFFQKLSKPELLAVIKCIEHDQFPNKTYKGLIKDISSSGIFFEADVVFEEGQMLTFEVPLKNGNEAKINGQIVWADDEGFGVVFANKR